MRRFLLVLCLLSGSCFSATVTCPENDSRIIVDTSMRKLFLCSPNEERKEYSVALGKGGTGKQREGDSKTPLGTYTLGTPRSSEKFHRFIPIHYPTASQKKKGYTGTFVGIHGPPLWFSWLAFATRWINWTNGCIAVGTKKEIEEIESWLKASRNVKLEVL